LPAAAAATAVPAAGRTPVDPTRLKPAAPFCTGGLLGCNWCEAADLPAPLLLLGVSSSITVRRRAPCICCVLAATCCMADLSCSFVMRDFPPFCCSCNGAALAADSGRSLDASAAPLL
jgi:hypothetical protein